VIGIDFSSSGTQSPEKPIFLLCDEADSV